MVSFILARSVANVQAAIEHIYPLVYEFKKPRIPKESIKEEEIITKMIPDDSDEDDDSDNDIDDIIESDPLELEPPKKKHKLHDVSHLTKRFKGGRSGKRPPGKRNDPTEDMIYVSDGEIDADDPDDF